MSKLRTLVAATLLAFAIVPLGATPAGACAEVQCYVNCVKGVLQGNLICAA